MKKKSLFVSLLSAAALLGQNPPVPSQYQSTYSELQGKLNALQSTITSQWNGQMGNSIYSSELLNANSTNGTFLLTSQARPKYMQELNALKSLGVQAVVVKIGFPLLYQPFMQFNGDPQDQSAYLSFYQQVIADVHAANMKVVVESASIFPGFFSANSGLNIMGYYQQLSFTNYLTGVATLNNLIVTQIQPDYLNVGSEPQTEVENTGFQQLGSPSGWASAVQAYMSMIPTPHPIPIGAGVGTWETNNSSAVVAALIPVVDYIDLHIYPINDPPGSPVDIPTNTINLINQAQSAGKRVAVSEAWLLKVSDENYPTSGVASSVTNFSLDSYSFWAPLDQEFLTDFYDLANWKDMIYFSAFWSRYYWAYEDYNSTSSLPPEELINASIAVASTALSAGQLTSTGTYVKSTLTTVAPLAAFNAASFSLHAAAPNSIISIFGPDVATGTGTAGSILGTTLAGTTVNISDSKGSTAAADLFFAAPNQVNALVPAGVAPGLATVTLTIGTGESFIGSLNVATSAPGLFAENGAGNGAAAAQVVTPQADGSLVYSGFPVNVSGGNAYLVLYGTGIAGRSSLSNVTATINGTAVAVSYAGPSNNFSGLDQVNVLLPTTLTSGTANVSLTVDGNVSNTVQFAIQ